MTDDVDPTRNAQPAERSDTLDEPPPDLWLVDRLLSCAPDLGLAAAMS